MNHPNRLSLPGCQGQERAQHVCHLLTGSIFNALIYIYICRFLSGNGRARHKNCIFQNNDLGGEGGIRTPDTLASMPHFECGAIDHSATSPRALSGVFAAGCDRELRSDEFIRPLIGAAGRSPVRPVAVASHLREAAIHKPPANRNWSATRPPGDTAISATADIRRRQDVILQRKVYRLRGLEPRRADHRAMLEPCLDQVPP